MVNLIVTFPNTYALVNVMPYGWREADPGESNFFRTLSILQHLSKYPDFPGLEFFTSNLLTFQDGPDLQEPCLIQMFCLNLQQGSQLDIPYQNTVLSPGSTLNYVPIFKNSPQLILLNKVISESQVFNMAHSLSLGYHIDWCINEYILIHPLI